MFSLSVSAAQLSRNSKDPVTRSPLYPSPVPAELRVQRTWRREDEKKGCEAESLNYGVRARCTCAIIAWPAFVIAFEVDDVTFSAPPRTEDRREKEDEWRTAAGVS